MATSKTIGPGTGGVGSAIVVARVDYTQLTGQTTALDDNLVNANSVCYKQTGLFAVGFNTITVPAGSGGVAIVPSVYSTGSLILKGITGDTGITIARAAPTILTFPSSAPASFGLTYAGSVYQAQAVTADAATNKITSVAHTLNNGDRVFVTATTLPTGLETGVWYYVVNDDGANTFELSLTSGGTTIDFTTNGTAVLITTANDYKLVWF